MRLDELAGMARAATGDIRAALDLAGTLGTRLPRPGGGRTLELWEALATLGAADLTVARAVEPHLDALAILAEAGLDPATLAGPDATWGVFAAEGPGVRLEERGLRLTGTKPWCSLAPSLSHALVTAWCGDDARRLYAVELGHEGVAVADVAWVARGLVKVPSGPVTFEAVPAEPVGAPGWYLERPGFAWGGVGVAAVWLGGAVGVARLLLDAAGSRDPDQIALMHLGAVDAALTSARALLAAAARAVDDGRAVGRDGAMLALRVRQVVAQTVEVVLLHADHAMGPGPLALDEEHARRVADLRLYVRQEHAERDQAALGRHLLDWAGTPSTDPGPTVGLGGWW